MSFNLPPLHGKVTFDTAQGKAALNEIQGKVKQSGQEAEKSSVSYVKLGAAVGVASAATELFLRGLLQVGPELKYFIDQGGKVGQVEKAFKSLSAAQGLAFDQMLKNGHSATKGLVSDFELMQQANRAMALGLPITADGFGKLSGAAVVLGQALGVNATESLQRLVGGIGKMETELLDELGVTVKATAAYEKYAAAHGKAADELTVSEQKLAFYNAAMDQVMQTTAKLDGVQLNASNRLEQLSVMWENVHNASAKAVADSPVLNTALSEVAIGLEKAFGPDNQSMVAEMTDYMNRFALGLVEVAEIAVKAFHGIGLAAVKAAQVLVATNPGTMFMSSLKAGLDEQQKLLELSYTNQMNGLDELHGKMEKAIEDHRAAGSAGKRSVTDLGAAANNAGDVIAVAAGKATAAWAKFRDVLQDSTMKMNRVFLEMARDSNQGLVLGMMQTSGSSGRDLDALNTRSGIGIAKLGDAGSFYNHAGMPGYDIKRETADLAKNLQALSNIFAVSTSEIGRTMASFAANSSGIAGGLGSLFGLGRRDGKGDDFGSGITGFLGKLGAIGGIASAGVGIISGIAGLFGGGSRKRDEAVRAQLEASKAAAEQEAARAHEKRMSGLDASAGGLNQFVKGGGITDAASGGRAGMYATATFGSMVQESGDVIGALKAIGPALDGIAQKAHEMGFALGDGVANLIGMQNVLGGDSGLSDQVQGLNQMMQGLADANLLNKDLFNAMGADASAVFARLMEGGATGNQAMALMQPTLQQLYEGQKLHGFAVDEATQALLDQAEAEGIVGDAFMSANERIVELLGILIETVGGQLPEAYRKAGDAAEEFGRKASNVPAPFTGKQYPLDEDPVPGFASGTGFRDFGSGTPAMLHNREAVFRPGQLERFAEIAINNGPDPGGGGGGGRPMLIRNVINVDRRQLLEVITEAMEEEGPEAQRFRSANRGREE